MRAKVLALGVVVGCASGGDRTSGNPALGDTTDGEETGTTGDPPTTTATGPDVDTTAGVTTDEPGDSSDETTEGGDACAEHWRVVRSAGFVTDVDRDSASGTIYAVGTNDDTGEGWAMAIDPCDGTVLADTTVSHAGSASTYVSTLTVRPEGLFVAGSNAMVMGDPPEGLYARLNKADLSTIWTQSVYGTAGSDSIEDVVLAASGRVWMAGTTDFGGGSNADAWMISGNTMGSSCSFSWDPTNSRGARAITVDGDEVVVAVLDGTYQLVLLGYDTTACDCDCMPAWTSPEPIVVGMSSTVAAEILVVGGQYYVVGFANDTGVSDGYYSQVSYVSSMGAALETYVDDPTALGDGLLAGATDGETLYVGGGQGWMGGSFAGATAVVQALSLPLGAGAMPLWEANPTDLNIVDGMSVETPPSGNLFVGGSYNGVGTVIRCDKQGSCG